MKTKALLLIAALVLAAAGLQWSSSLNAGAAVGLGAHVVPPQSTARPLAPAEVRRIESYMRQIFANERIRLVHTAPDAEVFLGEHFLGIVYPDDQPDGRTFYFEMAIFEEETLESPPSVRGR